MLEAVAAEQVGAGVTYVSRNAIFSSVHSVLDIKLTSMAGMVNWVRQISNFAGRTIITDTDDKYENALSIIRVVSEFKTVELLALTLKTKMLRKSADIMIVKVLFRQGGFL